jgi:uncharacterized paraquat-inducible protein A
MADRLQQVIDDTLALLTPDQLDLIATIRERPASERYRKSRRELAIVPDWRTCSRCGHRNYQPWAGYCPGCYAELNAEARQRRRQRCPA